MLEKYKLLTISTYYIHFMPWYERVDEMMMKAEHEDIGGEEEEK